MTKKTIVPLTTSYTSPFSILGDVDYYKIYELVRKIINAKRVIHATNTSSVKQKAGKFLEYCSTEETRRSAPARLWSLWHRNYKAWLHLHSIMQGCADEIVLEESNSIISDPSLKVQVKGLNAESIRSLLAPRILYEKYCWHAPFTTGVLQILTASPNCYEKRKQAHQEADSDVEMEDLTTLYEELSQDILEDTFMASQDKSTQEIGLSTPEAAITLVIAMLSFLYKCISFE
ncbi:hypothetical protein BDP27DRAFT_1369506 [Rhodocollybia butyracea]|uniref:Uncharacterized protein n=1 Tax=Rhodocollybia butyracea TaxID=206335 RepID=A0A9P5U0R3_9AGAR|nr:hypothetical protein BDP27DRAFT_1369506 [Rhodocollybia butyracea]